MFMTPEEKERYDRIDRQLEFLAAHQAQLSSDLAELQRVAAIHSQQIARQGEQIAKQGEQIAKQGEQIAAQGSQISSIADTVLRLTRILDERDRQTDAKINALIERDRQTDAKINALIGVVERYFSNGKKGSS